ncbi:MAG: oxidoreductase [Bacteroidota bacterium]
MKNNRWNTGDMPSLTGKKVIVTGANSGLGYEATKALSAAGASVVMACRNIEKGMQAKNRLENELNWSDLTVMKVDLGDLSSVRDFAQSYTDREERLDILVNNAGLMAIPFMTSVDGIEMQFAVNHLGHFALTGLLYPLLMSTPGARVVNVSSMAHNMGRLDLDNLENETGYSKWKAYGRSKLANLLFTHEMNRRLDGQDLMALSAHPGYAATELVFKGPELEQKKWKNSLMELGNRLLGQPASMGALPVLFAATSPAAERSAYYGPGGFAGMRGYPVKTKPVDGKVNDADAERLWNLSMKLSGIYWLNGR